MILVDPSNLIFFILQINFFVDPSYPLIKEPAATKKVNTTLANKKASHYSKTLVLSKGKIFHHLHPISNAQNSLLEEAKVETLESLGGLISKIKFPLSLAASQNERQPQNYNLEKYIPLVDKLIVSGSGSSSSSVLRWVPSNSYTF